MRIWLLRSAFYCESCVSFLQELLNDHQSIIHAIPVSSILRPSFFCDQCFALHCDNQFAVTSATSADACDAIPTVFTALPFKVPGLSPLRQWLSRSAISWPNVSAPKLLHYFVAQHPHQKSVGDLKSLSTAHPLLTHVQLRSKT